MEDIEAAEQDIEAAGTSAAVGLGTLVAVAGRNPVPDVGHDLEEPDRSLGQQSHRRVIGGSFGAASQGPSQC